MRDPPFGFSGICRNGRTPRHLARLRVVRSETEFSDKLLRCIDCGQDFVFSAGEQIFFQDKQFQHEPRHCKPCKAKRTKITAGVETDVVCAECGADTKVPFQPRQGRPVMCRSCFQRRGADASQGSRRAT